MQAHGTSLLYAAISRFNDVCSATVCHSRLAPIALKASAYALGCGVLLVEVRPETNSDGLQKASPIDLASPDDDGYGDIPLTSLITRQAPCSGPLFI